MSMQNKLKQGAKESEAHFTILLGCTAFLSIDFGRTFVTCARIFSCLLELAYHIQNISNLYLKIRLYGKYIHKAHFKLKALSSQCE